MTEKNEIAKMTTVPRKSLLVKMANKYDMDPEAFKQTIKKTLMPENTSNEQMAAFLLVANQYDLNPVTKEIYAFPARGGGITPVVGIDGWINLAQRRSEFDGMEFTFKENDKGEVVSCTCSLYRKDRARPVVITEYMEECRRGTDPWKSHPRRMLRHKSAIQGIRYAFGFSGIVDEDDAQVIYANATVVEQETSGAIAGVLEKAKAHQEEPAEEEEQEDNWPIQKDGEWLDSRGYVFHPNYVGVSAGGIPAINKGTGHFRKRRGCDDVSFSEWEKTEQARLFAKWEEEKPVISDAEDEDPPFETETEYLQKVSETAHQARSGGRGFSLPEILGFVSMAEGPDALAELEDLVRSLNEEEQVQARSAIDARLEVLGQG